MVIEHIPGKEFGRSFAANPARFAWLLGAGSSAAANVPTGYDMIIDFKARLFSAAIGIPRREIDPVDPMWRERIESHFEGRGGLPPAGYPDEYAAAFEAAFPTESERRSYIEQAVRQGSTSFGHRVLAALIASKQIPCLFTTNFDPLIEHATIVADELLPADNRAHLTVGALDSPGRAERCLAESAWPLLVKLHGDYKSVRLKNTTIELQAEDAALRQVLVGACNRFGLIVVGYSGRDTSVMQALREALSGPLPFPSGVRWVIRSGATPLPAVCEFLDAAEDAGIETKFVESETFDEFAADIDRQVAFPDVLSAHVREARLSPVVQPVVLPTIEGSTFPVLRCSALPLLSVPSVARRLALTQPMTVPEARSALRVAKVFGIALPRGREVAAFGADEDLQKAFGDYGATVEEEVRLSPESDSLHLGLIYDGLVRALTRGRPIRPILTRGGHSIVVSADSPTRTPEQVHRHRERLAPLQSAYADSLVGIVPGGSLRFAEGVRIRLESHDGQWWCVFDPYTWIDLPPVDRLPGNTDVPLSREYDRHQIPDWRRERWARRYNPKWSAILDAWASLLVAGTQDTIHAIGLRDRAGIDAVYTISGTTAWSRPARMTSTGSPGA